MLNRTTEGQNFIITSMMKHTWKDFDEYYSFYQATHPEFSTVSNPKTLSEMQKEFELLGAQVAVHRQDGKQETLPLGELYREPEKGRHGVTVLEPGDLIAGVTIPALPDGGGTAYLEVRQKAAFDWALVSCAVKLVEGALCDELSERRAPVDMSH